MLTRHIGEGTLCHVPNLCWSTNLEKQPMKLLSDWPGTQAAKRKRTKGGDGAYRARYDFLA